MTNIDYYNHSECDKIDALCVNAYATHYLDPENDCSLILETSWGKVPVDLTPAVKCGETCTELKLWPDDCAEPTMLKYVGECDTYCIDGDDLSRIISLTKLKDVDQNTEPSDGMVLMYNETTNKWEYFDLGSFVTRIGDTITGLQQTINNLTSRVRNLELTLQRPEGIPTTSRVVWGNDINLYGDQTNTDDHTHGFFTHSVNTNVTNDLYFS
jgi:hypothetical protein